MRMPISRAVAAVSLAVAAPPAPAQQESEANRYRTPAPYTDPAFPAAPVPPPDSSYLIPLGEVLFVDTAIWSFNYAAGKQFAKISWGSIQQNFEKGWIALEPGTAPDTLAIPAARNRGVIFEFTAS